MPEETIVTIQGEKVMERAVNSDAGAEIMLANWLLEELSIPASNSTRILVAECIRLLAKEGGTLKTAAEFIHQSARFSQLSGERINRFWFEDRKYIVVVNPQAIVGMSESAVRGPEWEDMPESWRKNNPKIGGGRG